MHTRVLVHEVGGVLLLLQREVLDHRLAGGRVHQHVAVDLQVLPHDERLHRPHVQTLQRVLHPEAKLPRILANLVEVPAQGRGGGCEAPGQRQHTCRAAGTHLAMSFFSWMNFTFARMSVDNSMAWLNPFSPPYDTSQMLTMTACNLRARRRLRTGLRLLPGRSASATHLPSSKSDWLSSVLKSADPARIMPATLGCDTDGQQKRVRRGA